MRTRAIVGGFLLAALASVAFACLGLWQLARGHVKDSRLAAFERALHADPAALAASLDGAAPPPLRVRGRGVFAGDATVLLDNQTLDGRVGAHVLTLFRPDAASGAVLVDRGFVALPPTREVPPLEPAPAEPVAIEGLLVASPATGLRLGDPHGARGAPRLVNYLDVQTLGHDFAAPLYDGVLLLDPSAPGGFERRWQALPNTLPPERHRAYAVQWFALAAAAWITYGVLLWRRRRKN